MQWERIHFVSHVQILIYEISFLNLLHSKISRQSITSLEEFQCNFKSVQFHEDFNTITYFWQRTKKEFDKIERTASHVRKLVKKKLDFNVNPVLANKS